MGSLFDDRLLAGRLASEVRGDPPIAVSDLDDAVFHKTDPERTRRSVRAFMRYLDALAEREVPATVFSTHLSPVLEARRSR